MGNSYTWQQAIDYVKPYIKSIPTSTLDVIACDQTNAAIWRAYPFRWAQATLTSASSALRLVDGQQDYGIGTLTGGGFYQLLRVRISRTDVSPWIIREKDITNWLAPNLEQQGAVDTLKAICYEPVSSGLRLDMAASVTSPATYQIDGEYWFQPIRITAVGSTIVFPDAYFQTVIECLKWKYYQLGDDRRALDQKAVFDASLAEMVAQEDYGDAPGTRFPEGGLGTSRAGNPGLFGFY